MAATCDMPGEPQQSGVDLSRDHPGSRAPNGIKRVTAGGSAAQRRTALTTARRRRRNRRASRSPTPVQDAESGAVGEATEALRSAAQQLPSRQGQPVSSAADPDPTTDTHRWRRRRCQRTRSRHQNRYRQRVPRVRALSAEAAQDGTCRLGCWQLKWRCSSSAR